MSTPISRGIGQRMGADEVLAQRVRRRWRPSRRPRPASGSAAAAGRGRCPTASSPRRCAGGPSSASGIRSAPAQPAIAVEARARAHQRQRLGDRAAVGLDVVRPPEHQRHRCAAGSGARPAAAAPAPRRRAAQMRWACGTGRRRGCCGPWAGSPGVRIRSPPGTGAMKRPPRARSRAGNFGRPAAAVSAACGARLGVVGHQVPDSSARAASVIGRPSDMQPVGDQRAFGLQQLEPQRVGRWPPRSTAAACSAIRASSSARSGASGVGRAPAGQAVLQVQQALVEARPAPAAASGG